KGTHNNADYLSRQECQTNTLRSYHQTNGMNIDEYNNIVNYLKDPSLLNKNLQLVYKKKAPKFFLRGGSLFKRNKTTPENPYLVITEEQFEDIMHELHDLAGHQGITNTFAKVRARFYWPGMFD